MAKFHKTEWDEEKIKEFWELNELENELVSSKFLPPDFYASILKDVSSFMPPRGRVADIGAGTGTLCELLADSGFDTYGVDASEKGAAKLAEKFAALNKKVTVKTGLIYAIPFAADFFDCVFATEVLEHILPEKLNAAVMEVKRALKPGGGFILTVPYNETIQTAVCPDCHALFPLNQHLSSFDEIKMSRLMESSGLEVKFCKLVPKLPLSGNFLKDTAKKLIAKIDKRIISFVYGSIFITVAQKAR